MRQFHSDAVTTGEKASNSSLAGREQVPRAENHSPEGISSVAQLNLLA